MEKTQVLSKRLRLEDVDEHLCLTKNLTDQSVYIISGQNSDSIIAPGFIKGDSLLSYFMNWGMTGALKSFFVNFLLSTYEKKVVRKMLKLILVLLNPILKKFYSKRIELSAWGFLCRPFKICTIFC